MPVYRYVIDYENAFTRSVASPEIATANVPLGSFIRIDFPQPPPAGATILNVYRTIGDGTTPNYIHRYVLAASALNVTDEATDSGFLTTGQTPILGGLGLLPQGAKYVAYHVNRTWWGNLPNFPSRVMFSRDGAPEVFSATWITEFAPNDGDEITGLIGLPTGLLIGKRRSVHSFIGDPGEPPDIEPSGFKRELSGKVGVGAPASLAASGRYAYFIGDDARPYRCDGVSEPEELGAAIEGILPTNLAAVVGFVDHDNKYRVCIDTESFESWEVRYNRWAERLTFEAHRNAVAVAAGFSAPDLKQRYALAGDRAIRFGERGQPTSYLDPFFVKIGPKGHGTFERDFAELFAQIRFKGTLDLIWETDTSTAPVSARTVPLGTHAATATALRALPPEVYGRRLFFGFRGASAPEILLEGVTDDRVALGALAPAP